MWRRMRRAGTLAGAEAATSALTYPSARIGCLATSSGTGMDDHKLGLAILQRIFEFLRLKEGVSDLDLTDPVPSCDTVFDPNNTET